MGKEEKKPGKRSLIKTEKVSWWDEEVSLKEVKSFAKKIAIYWNPIVVPFTVLYLYSAWILKHLYRAGKNFANKDISWYWKGTLVILIILKLVYIINPADPIPDFIPYVGWLDDLAVFKAMLGAIIAFNRISERSLETEEGDDLLPEEC